jgi:hypothetical protein
LHSARLETLLARLLTDADLRRAFLNDPLRVADEQGLDAAEREAMLAIDRPGLLLAARSIAAKRGGSGPGGSAASH